MTAQVLTIGDLAKYFGISKKRIYEMLQREMPAGFPCFRLGGGWYVDLDQMRDWMCQRIEEKALGRSANISQERAVTNKRSIK